MSWKSSGAAFALSLSHFLSPPLLLPLPPSLPLALPWFFLSADLYCISHCRAPRRAQTASDKVRTAQILFFVESEPGIWNCASPKMCSFKYDVKISAKDDLQINAKVMPKESKQNCFFLKTTLPFLTTLSTSSASALEKGEALKCVIVGPPPVKFAGQLSAASHHDVASVTGRGLSWSRPCVFALKVLLLAQTSEPALHRTVSCIWSESGSCRAGSRALCLPLLSHTASVLLFRNLGRMFFLATVLLFGKIVYLLFF